MAFFALKKIPFFHRKIATSLWKMVRFTQKLAYMILVGICKKDRGKFWYFDFCQFYGCRNPKKCRFLSDWAAEPPKKSRKIKISKIPTAILYCRTISKDQLYQILYWLDHFPETSSNFSAEKKWWFQGCDSGFRSQPWSKPWSKPWSQPWSKPVTTRFRPGFRSKSQPWSQP